MKLYESLRLTAGGLCPQSVFDLNFQHLVLHLSYRWHSGARSILPGLYQWGIIASLLLAPPVPYLFYDTRAVVRHFAEEGNGGSSSTAVGL